MPGKELEENGTIQKAALSLEYLSWKFSVTIVSLLSFFVFHFILCGFHAAPNVFGVHFFHPKMTTTEKKNNRIVGRRQRTTTANGNGGKVVIVLILLYFMHSIMNAMAVWFCRRWFVDAGARKKHTVVAAAAHRNTT